MRDSVVNARLILDLPLPFPGSKTSGTRTYAACDRREFVGRHDRISPLPVAPLAVGGADHAHVGVEVAPLGRFDQADALPFHGYFPPSVRSCDSSTGTSFGKVTVVRDI